MFSNMRNNLVRRDPVEVDRELVGLDNLQRNITQLSEEYQNIKHELSTIKRSLTSLEHSLTENSRIRATTDSESAARLRELETKVDNNAREHSFELDRTLTKLKEDLRTEFAGNIRDNSTQVNKLADWISEHKDSYKRLSENVTELTLIVSQLKTDNSRVERIGIIVVAAVGVSLWKVFLGG